MPYKAYINFLLYSIANSSLFDINLTLPNLNKLLQRYPTIYTISTISTTSTTSTILVRKPSNRQSNLIKVLNTLPPHYQVTLAA